MIKVDYTNICQDIIGAENGLDIEFEFSNYSQKISQIITKIHESKNLTTSYYNCLNSCEDYEVLKEVNDYAQSVQGKFDNIGVIGISTSILGMQTIAEAILEPYWNTLKKEKRNGYPRLHFINYIDPDNLINLAAIRDLKKSLIIVSSRKGTQAEVMSIFMLAKRRLESELGEKFRSHLIVCTEKGSLLYQIAKQEGIKCFEISRNTTSRFSIFSPVCLMPLALVGIDINEILFGMKDGIEKTKNPDIYQNCAAQLALIHYLSYVQKKKIFSIIMSFSSRLKSLPAWSSHIKSQSLSKSYNKDNQYAPVSQIPYPAYGSIDEYSMLQILTKGPQNQLINILRVQNFDSDSIIPEIFQYTGIGYLGGKPISKLLNAEVNAFEMILRNNNCPNITITIPQVTPYYIGQFFALEIINTFIQAELYNINPFEESSLEELNNYVSAQMGQVGYEQTLEEIQRKRDNATSKFVLLE